MTDTLSAVGLFVGVAGYCWSYLVLEVRNRERIRRRPDHNKIRQLERECGIN